MKTSPLLAVVLVVACSKGKTSGVSTDHYQETVGRQNRSGDLQATLAATGDVVSVTFAKPAADWKESRKFKMPATAPAALIASAGCTVKAKTGGEWWIVDPGQTCTVDGKTLTIASGKIWVMRGALNADLSGKLGDTDYQLLYPLLVDADDALPMP